MIFRLAAFLALLIALHAQPSPKDSKPQDVTGWDKIHWGMTISEARATYQIQTQPKNDDGWTLLVLNPVKIGDVKMETQVGARAGSSTISSIRLWSFFGVPNSAPSAGPQDFDTLRSILTQKYGPPAGEETSRGENFRLLKTVRWMFPSTSIQLSLEQSSSIPNLGNIFLDFVPVGK